MAKKLFEFIEDGRYPETRELSVAEVERLQVELASKGRKNREQLIESYQQLGLTFAQAEQAVKIDETARELMKSDPFSAYLNCL
jgi:hypothetical protein